MTAVWSETADGWQLLDPQGFADESALHSLVEESPELLPLAETPRLAVVGREVRLGSNQVDLLAIESSGRLCVMEVKLAHNAEARRAVVAQVLSYAAYLHGLTVEQLEADVLPEHLVRRGFASLSEAAQQAAQGGDFDLDVFRAGLSEALGTGSFRLVLVLDDAPAELIRTVGYLEAITLETLLIDLITVKAYQVGGHRVLVPQRVEPERRQLDPRAQGDARPSSRQGTSSSGPEVFIASIEHAEPEMKRHLQRLAEWAVALSDLDLCTIGSYAGLRGEVTLLPRLRRDNAGLVTIWNWRSTQVLQFWRSVFERRAPNALQKVDSLLEPSRVGQGNTTSEVTEDLLSALTEAYREAVHGDDSQRPM